MAAPYSACIMGAMKQKIAIDLDNTVFDTARLIHDICARHNADFNAMTSYDLYTCLPKNVVDEIMNAFNTVELHNMPVLHSKIPEILNKMHDRPDTEVYFITERPVAAADMDIGQLTRAGIIFDRKNIVHCKPKIDALRDYGINLCFDDSPNIVRDCITNNIDVVMISNQDTPYNHDLRNSVEYYANLADALVARGFE